MKQILQKSLLLIMGISIFSGSVFSAAVPANTPTTTGNPSEKTAPMPTVKEVINSFTSASRSERKQRVKEAKKELKEYKKLKKSGADPSTNKVLLIVLAILLPPLAVYLHQGEINSKFWISLLLTLLFFIPGVIYALLVVTGEI